MTLNKIKIDTQFVNPELMRDMSKGFYTTVTNENFVHIGDVKFIPAEKLKIGQKVKLGVWERNFYLWYESNIIEFERKKAEERHIAEEKRKTDKKWAIIFKKAKSKLFWDYYDIPFQFDIEVKEVLKGLSMGSNGCGTNKRTKFHINLKEDFKQGRLVRKSGDYLCTNSSSRWGANWSGSIGEGLWNVDSDGVRRIITCKECLKKLERFKK